MYKQYVVVAETTLTPSSRISDCKFLRIDTQPKNRSNGLKSGPGMSLCGCGPGRHKFSNASYEMTVGTAPAHERAGITRDKCTAANLCSGLWPGRGDGRGIGDPGQFEATPGDSAEVNGLFSVCDCM